MESIENHFGKEWRNLYYCGERGRKGGQKREIEMEGCDDENLNNYGNMIFMKYQLCLGRSRK